MRRAKVDFPERRYAVEIPFQSSETKKRTTDQSSFPRLRRIEIDDLFGVYNHRIDLNLDSHVTFLHGPNGVGKTILLRMIDAVLSGRLNDFPQVPFSRFQILFHDKSAIEITTTNESPEEGEATLSLVSNGKTHTSRIRLRSEADHIASQFKYLKPHGRLPDAWVDTRDGEVLSSEELISRYGDRARRLPFFAASETKDGPNWYSLFLERSNSYFIQEQRLFRVARQERDRHLRPWREPEKFVPTVIEYSRDFRNRIAQSMAEYGRKSQALDQSFPQRMTSEKAALEVHEIRDRLAELEEQTADLKQIGVLEEAPVHPLPTGALESMDPTKALVMSLYVEDTKAKISALDDLANRARLLLNNVNLKYRNKRVRIDREQGFVAESDGQELLALDSLSSGEQHELVLYYDLLFNVPSNTIVLIDEPELSLHVAWQKRFLPDLLEVVKISGFDALIATHSPYIVGDSYDLMVSLGDVD